MPYEYYLESENEKRMFPSKVIEGMHNLMDKIPHHKLENGTYVVFENQKDKDIGLPGLLSAIASGRGSFIEPFIRIDSTRVVLSVVGDNDVDRYLYSFAVWCQKHFPCQLYEGSEAVPLEELLSEEEVIPSID